MVSRGCIVVVVSRLARPLSSLVHGLLFVRGFVVGLPIEEVVSKVRRKVGGRVEYFAR